jgi:hypothetical protein
LVTAMQAHKPTIPDFAQTAPDEMRETGRSQGKPMTRRHRDRPAQDR